MPDLEIYRPRRETWLRRTLRSLTLGPYNTKDPALARLFGGSPSSAGVPVTEHTAMNYSAVWSAVNLISSDIAAVPLKLYKREGQGKADFSTHALHRLVHSQPNPDMPSMVFRKTLTAHRLVWGNGYAEIERDGAGRPVALWPLMPYAVQPFYTTGGALRYRVYNPGGGTIEFAPADMLHLRGLSDDGICGLSVIAKARESLGLGIAAERFGATFFGNGSTFGGVISYPAGVGNNTQTRKDNREALEKVHQGVDRAHRFLALYEGAQYQQLGVPPNDAQFLETREFQIEEVCRWFNIQPHKLKHLKRSTNNNIEHQSIEYVTDTLESHWVEWEQELNMKLVAPLERAIQVIEHVREGRLRGDSVSRSELQTKQFSIAMLTPNEGRAQENRNPVEGGDRAFVAMNLIPLDRVDEWFDVTLKAKAEPPPPPKPDKTDDAKDEINALQEALVEARKVAQKAEDLRDLAQSRFEAELSAHLDAKTRRLDEIEAFAAEAERLRQARDWFALDAHDNRIALDLAVQEVGTLKADLDATAAARDASLMQATAAREAQAVAEAARAAAEQAREAAVTLADVLTKQRDAAAEGTQTFRAAKEAAEAALLEAQAQAAVAAAETQAAIAARDSALATCDVLRTTASAIEQERDAAKADVVEYKAVAQAQMDACESERSRRTAAQEAITLTWEPKAQQLEAEAETLRADLARARADIATELDKARTFRASMLASMRSLFAEATERLLAKESNAARKQQATGEKLRAWVDRFYPLHQETARDVFRPIVGPWTAVTGGDPVALLERLVHEHVSGSVVAMRLIAEADGDDERALALERTLSRWEHERADATADRLLREGMAGHG